MVNAFMKVIDGIKWISLVLVITIVFGCSNTGDNIQNTKSNITIDSSNPLIPFMAITGKPTNIQIQRYMDNFKSVGIDQFLIYPRSGLELEYMSNEWLDVCEYIIEYAAKNEMSIWLYDDYNWPSGRCKGKVIQTNSDYASKKICVWADYDPMGKKLGKSKVNRDYYWTISSVPLYADLLNPEAVKSFIELTHEKYYQRFSQYFGTVVKGFFSDEPSSGYAATHHNTKGSILELPYWTGMEKEYREYTGRDFKLDIETFLDGGGTTDFWKDYFQLYGKRFTTSYFDQIREWCDNHGILFTGHLMSETPPANTIMFSGNPMTAIQSFSLPGIDNISTNTEIGTLEWVTFKMVENASDNIETGAFAELFALGPSDMPLGKMRQMTWLTAMHGVDRYLLAISPLDSRANIEKPHYYNPYTTTQPWFKALKEFGDDAKNAAVYANKKPIQKIAVRYPQSLTATTRFLPDGEKPVFKLPVLLKNLINCQWDPRLIGEDASSVSEYQAVFSLTQKGIIEDKTGEIFNSLDELSSWMDKNIERTATVETKDGSQVENILLKSFEDGSFCIVSLLDTSLGELVLKQAGQKDIILELPEYGIFTYTVGQSVPEVKNVLELSVDEKLPYKLTSQNTMRAVFDETGTFTFKLDKNLDGLSIAVRNYGDTVRIKMDGIELSTTKPSQLLPEGLKELYFESEKISLKEGVHTLSLLTESHDYPYFPSAIIGGDFGMNGTNLFKLPKTVSISGYREQGLMDYIGNITFNTKINTGEYEYLSINTGGLVAEIFINGKSIGKKAWAPFRWEIPQMYQNKDVDLEIRLWTSVGPLFSNFPVKYGLEKYIKYAPK